MKIQAALICSVAAACVALGAQAKETLSVSTNAFAPNAVVPAKYTGDGADVSPAITWSDVPKGTVSIAVSCEDPDAPAGTWWHWFVYNVPASTKGLGEGLGHSKVFKDGTMQGTNDFGNTGYNGPAPPAGKVHHYIFKVYALGTKLTGVLDKNTFNQAISKHVLAEGQVVGTYKR